MKIQCEKCGLTYEVGPEYAGRRVECQCGEKITVPTREIYRVAIKRRNFFSCADAEFSFDFGSGAGTVAGADAGFYVEIIGGASFALKDFPVSVFGLSEISEVSVIGAEISTERFFRLLIGKIIAQGGFAELDSGKGKKHGKRDSVRLFGDYISIQHGGAFNAMLEMGIQGEKRVLLENITAIQIKPPRFTAGYLQFSVKGEVASKGGILSAVGDENTITTYGTFGSLIACAIRDYIFDWQRAHRSVR